MLRRTARILVAAAVTAAAVAFAPPAAAEPFEPETWSISPGGGYDASGLIEIVVLPGGMIITCSVSFGMFAPAGPAVVNPIGRIGTIIFESCEGPLGPVMATWTGGSVSLIGYTYDPGGEGDPSIPETVGYLAGLALHFGMTGCEFGISGNAPFTYDNDTAELRLDDGMLPPGVAPVAPVNVAGCFGLVNPTDNVIIQGVLHVTPPQTIVGNQF